VSKDAMFNLKEHCDAESEAKGHPPNSDKVFSRTETTSSILEPCRCVSTRYYRLLRPSRYVVGAELPTFGYKMPSLCNANGDEPYFVRTAC
jgi:hypothetical protein